MTQVAQAALGILLVTAFTYVVMVLATGSFSTPRRARRIPTRSELVGLTCTIRSLRVDSIHGQARLRGGAVISVRSPDDRMFMGDDALIFDYDPDGRFFWVMPLVTEADPESRGAR